MSLQTSLGFLITKGSEAQEPAQVVPMEESDHTETDVEQPSPDGLQGSDGLAPAAESAKDADAAEPAAQTVTGLRRSTRTRKPRKQLVVQQEEAESSQDSSSESSSSPSESQASGSEAKDAQANASSRTQITLNAMFAQVKTSPTGAGEAVTKDQSGSADATAEPMVVDIATDQDKNAAPGDAETTGCAAEDKKCGCCPEEVMMFLRGLLETVSGCSNHSSTHIKAAIGTLLSMNDSPRPVRRSQAEATASSRPLTKRQREALVRKKRYAELCEQRRKAKEEKERARKERRRLQKEARLRKKQKQEEKKRARQAKLLQKKKEREERLRKEKEKKRMRAQKREEERMLRAQKKEEEKRMRAQKREEEKRLRAQKKEEEKRRKTEERLRREAEKKKQREAARLEKERQEAEALQRKLGNAAVLSSFLVEAAAVVPGDSEAQVDGADAGGKHASVFRKYIPAPHCTVAEVRAPAARSGNAAFSDLLAVLKGGHDSDASSGKEPVDGEHNPVLTCLSKENPFRSRFRRRTRTGRVVVHTVERSAASSSNEASPLLATTQADAPMTAPSASASEPSPAAQEPEKQPVQPTPAVRQEPVPVDPSVPQARRMLTAYVPKATAVAEMDLSAQRPCNALGLKSQPQGEQRDRSRIDPRVPRTRRLPRRASERRKLLRFHTNYRPPFVGLYPFVSSVIGPRNGHYIMDDDLIDYLVDSDEEWNREEEDGVELSSDEEEEEVVGDAEDGAPLLRPDGFEDDGFVSDGENVAEDEEAGELLAASLDDDAAGETEGDLTGKKRGRDDGDSGRALAGAGSGAGTKRHRPDAVASVIGPWLAPLTQFTVDKLRTLSGFDDCNLCPRGLARKRVNAPRPAPFVVGCRDMTQLCCRPFAVGGRAFRSTVPLAPGYEKVWKSLAEGNGLEVAPDSLPPAGETTSVKK